MGVSVLTARLQVIAGVEAKIKGTEGQLDAEYDRMYGLEALMDVKTNSDDFTEEDCNQTEAQYNACCQGIAALEDQIDALKDERERLFIADDDVSAATPPPLSAARLAPPPPRQMSSSASHPPPSSSSSSSRGGGAPVPAARRGSLEGASKPTPSPRTSPQKPPPSSTDKRARIMEELIATEESFGTDLRVVETTFLNDNGMEEHGIDKGTLFGNIVQIAEISERTLKALQDEGAKPLADQEVGQVFLNLSTEIESTYVTYCVNYEAANILLNTEYAEDDHKQRYFAERHRRLSESSAAWDLNSCLIKPVQRIMKYPMLLKEMQSSTNPAHKDAANLGIASEKMAAVAKVINERKRTKELLKRYISSDADAANQASSSKSVGGKLLHAFSKKGGRFTERIRGQLYRRSSAEDDDSTEAEEHRQYATNVKNAQTLDSSAQTLKKCIQKHADQLKASSKCFLDCGTKLLAVYEKDDLADEAALVKASIVGIHSVTEVYASSLAHKVYDPLTSFHTVFSNPFKLIAKCEDKRLDFERMKRKYKAAEKDPEKQRVLKGDLSLAESTFKALYV